MAVLGKILGFLLLVWGGLMVFSGLFWALQGLGIIMWPPESFMLADRKWTLYGLIWAALGVLLIRFLRRRGSSGE